MESLFGQVAKTFIYSGATLARFNSRLLCSLLGHETERDNDDQPTLFVFNNHLNREHAFRVYADDEITQSMVVEAGFDVNQMTYIFVHGWLGGIHNELWLSEAKNAALQSSLSRRYNPSQFYSGYDDEHDNSTNNITIINDRETTSKYFRENFVDLEERRGRQQESLFRPNVIIVDWSDFAQGTLYTATQNSFKVARRLGRLLSQLSTVGKLKPELMHCLGHSIGTHICGQAARQAFPPSSLSDDFISLEEFVSNLPGPALTSRSLEGNNNKKVLGGAVRSLPRQRMGRITALDPGGFCYELGIKNETTYRGLRPSDALLVDAYYSNRSPFGNKYQVATYNVRINNGFFQRPCSVWKNPEVASAYFRAAVRFTIGNIGHNDILTCDHYFATRFAHQLLPRSCSYVAYACDSYRNYLRGRCGLCNTPKQCYVMDFEYQRANASITNVKEQMLRYSTSMNDEFDQDSTLTDEQPLGGVPYGNRQIYYMKVDYDKPFCGECFFFSFTFYLACSNSNSNIFFHKLAITFRLRVNLDREVVDLRSFRSDWLKLRFYGREEEVLNVRDASTGKVTDALSVYGAWADNEEEGIRMEEEFGVDESTRTALFEIVSAVPALMDEKSMETNPIASVLVEYDNELHRRQDPLANPILSIRIDNMSSGDPK